MTPIILESPTPPSPSPAAGGMEGLLLDSLDLNDGGTICLEALEFSPAKKLLEWVKGADADGAKLLRMARHENSEFNLRIRVINSTKNLVLDTIGSIIDNVQEAERVAAGARGRGLALVWTPIGSTYSFTFYVLAGEVEKVPIEVTGGDAGYFVNAPVLNVKLYTSPFGYGPEVTTGTTTASLPLVTMTVADVPGDVPAEARVIVTDAAAQSRDYVAVGLENYYYGAGPSLLTEAGSMVTTGFAGAANTRAGSYSSPNIVRATLFGPSPVAVCSSAELTHKGTYRNMFRLWASSVNVSARLAWRQGRDQWTTEPWVQAPFKDGWWETDLGECKVREALLGTQSWQWRLEAKTAVRGDTIDVDIHEMMPSGEGYAKARDAQVYETPKVFSVHDAFDVGTGPLDANNMDIGGTWTGAGDADDFQVTSGVAYRDAASDVSATGRFAVAGTTSFTDVVVQVDIKVDSVAPAVDQYLGVVARYTSATNAAVLRVVPSTGTIQLMKWAAGPSTQSLSDPVVLGAMPPDTWHRLRLMILADGRYMVWFGEGETDEVPLVMSGSNIELATGGVLASGKIGMYDEHTTAGTFARYYHYFLGFPPTVDAACFASQSLEFRCYGDDPALREDSTGTYWGRPPETRGGRVWLPPAGTVDRTSRIAVLARRNDIETQPAPNVTDSTSVAVAYRPRWINVPRQG